ncbi:MAG: acyl carrier protein [Verrucomicrobiota bacterium]
MSETPQVQTKLLEFLREGIFSPEIAVSAETDLVANGFDSMSLVSLLLFVERNFGLWIPQHELNETNLKTPHTLATLITRLLHERNRPS